MSLLKSQLDQERKRVKEMWYKNCDQLHDFDEILAAKDEEMQCLKSSPGGVAPEEYRSELPSRETLPPVRPRRGKTPPVSASFTLNCIIRIRKA